jgi:hypothetical protein
MSPDRPGRRVSAFPVRSQRGAQTVEIALTFFAFIVILVGIVELIRALWMWTILGEATRRGARVAAVCDINDDAIYREVTAFPIGLTPDNVTVQYDYAYAPDPMTSPSGFTSVFYGAGNGPSAQSVAEIRAATQVFVRVGITNFNPPFAFLFPWGTRDAGEPAILTPSEGYIARYFATTLPAESLGWNPSGGSDQRGAFQPCP